MSEKESKGIDGFIDGQQNCQQKDKKIITRNQGQFSKIILMVQSIEQKISYLKDAWPHISQTQMKTCLHALPNISELKNKILSFAPFRHLMHEYVKQPKLSVREFSKIYQIPVQLSPFENIQGISTIQLNFQENLIKYFSEFDSFSQLPQQIQTTINKLREPLQSPFSIQINNVPASNLNNKQENLLYDEIQFLQKQENIQNYQRTRNMNGYKAEKEINKTAKLEKQSLLRQKNNYLSNRHEQKTEKISFIEHLAQKQKKNLQIYEIPIKIKIQPLNIKTLYQIPIEMNIVNDIGESETNQIRKNKQDNIPFEVNSIPMENLKQSLEKQEKKGQKVKPLDSKAMHLSASVESLTYQFGKQDKSEAMNKNKADNENAVGWDHHPQLDFIESQEIGQSKSNNMYESFGTSSRVNKNSLNFKESCIPKKKKDSKIFETVNLKANNIMYVIDSESSSQGSRTDREMLISDPGKKTQNMQINLHQNMIKEVPFEISQYYDLQDKLCASEEENIQLYERLKNCQEEIIQLKQKIIQQKGILCEIQGEKKQLHFHQLKQVFQRQRNELKNIKQQVLLRSNEQLSLELQNDNLNEELKKVKSQLLKREDEIQQLGQNIRDIENCFIKELEKMNNEIFQKEALFRETQQKIKYLQHEKKEMIKVQLEITAEIEEANREIQERRNELKDLKQQNQELKEQIEVLEKQKIDVKNVKMMDDEEYEKLKEDFIYEYELKEKQNQELNIEKQRLYKEVLKSREELDYHKNALEEHQKVIQDLREELERSHENWYQKKMSPFENQTSFLKRQLHYVCKELELKDIEIKQLNFQIKKIKKEQGIKISFEEVSKSQQNIFFYDLKEVINEYQEIIYHHHDIIQQLQERVYEYLTDAIEKEHEGEKLYEDLVSLEKDFHDLMIDKINLQLQNKKLKKTIKISEKKISSIGNKLVYVAKDKLHENLPEQLKGKNYFKSQNSTVKLGQFDP